MGGTIIVSDMGGYEEPNVPRERLEAAWAEAQRADLLLFVLCATNAAREPDRRLVAQLRDHFATQPALRPPPVVGVLTHIDVLRPRREWTPPYNIVSADSTKAQSIRGALHAVSTELHLPPELMVPVCLLPERLYNVEEALVPLLVQALPDAKRDAFAPESQDAAPARGVGTAWASSTSNRPVAVATQWGGGEKVPGAWADQGKNVNSNSRCASKPSDHRVS